MSDNKLNNIEELLAHQEQQISDLNDIVTDQWGEINTLKKSMAKLQGKISMLEDTPSEGEALSPADQAERDRPPHY